MRDICRVAALAVVMSAGSGMTGALAGTPIVDLGIGDVGELLGTGAATSEGLVAQYLARIGAYDHAYGSQPGVNAVLALNPNAMARARELDAERRAGKVRGPLHGVPIVIKDNYDTADMPTTDASEALRDFRPREDATVVARLRAAGAIVLAKTNLQEFAAGVTTISSLGGQTRDPYDQTRNPGGSSGGTAAAVASSFAAGGMGTDTCGSIRLPASYNNLVGLRPTKGLTSISGVAPLSSTQDVTGPITKTVRDAALLLDVVAGYDPTDPATAISQGKTPSSYASSLSVDALKGKRLGLLVAEKYLGTDPTEKPTTDVIRAAAEEMRTRGAEVVEVQMPQDVAEALAGARTTTFEFRRDLNAWLGQPGASFDPRIAALTPPVDVTTLTDVIASGKVTPTVMSKIKEYQAAPDKPNATEDYAKALVNRRKAADGLKALFAEKRLDALIYPEIKATARVVGDKKDPDDNCGISPYSGFPALNLPAGFAADDGMPVGVELLGLPFTEASLLAMGYDFEQATHHRTPPKSTPELGR